MYLDIYILKLVTFKESNFQAVKRFIRSTKAYPDDTIYCFRMNILIHILIRTTDFLLYVILGAGASQSLSFVIFMIINYVLMSW